MINGTKRNQKQQPAKHQARLQVAGSEERTDRQMLLSMEYGLRAAFRLLRNYISGWSGTRKPCKNVHDIVSKWAPASENNTDKYIEFVCKQTGLHQFQSLNFSDRKTMIAIVAAMAEVECGRKIDINLIESAYDLAR